MKKNEMIRWLALYLLIGLVGAAAFAFGAVEIWAREWLRFGAILCLCLVMWNSGSVRIFPRRALMLVMPAVALILFGMFQTVPLTRGMLAMLSPSAAALYEGTVPGEDSGDMTTWLLDHAAESGVRVDPDEQVTPWVEDDPPAGLGATLSVNPDATRRACLTWLTHIILFLAAACIASHDWARYRLLWGIGFWAGALGLVGVIQQFSWNGLLLWIREKPPGTHPLGPYVNDNHFAGFVELGALVVLGLLLALIGRHGGRLNIAALRDAVMDKEWTFPRLLMAATLCALAVAGLALSRSEGGALALLTGLMFLLLVKRMRTILVFLALAIVLCGVAVGLVQWVGEDVSQAEGVPFILAATDPSGSMRLEAWGNTLEIFADYPIVGTGLGSFRWIYPSYQRSGEWMDWNHAHNDFLQILSETGTVGALLLIWGLVVFSFFILLPALRSRGEGMQWTTVAVAAAIIAMLVHSVFDFNLQIPANAGLFAVLLGVLTGASENHRPEQGSSGETISDA